MSSWQPISVEELEELVSRQLLACTPDQQAGFASVRVPFLEMPIHRLGGIEKVLVVAKLPSGLLYYEDVEEGFEIGLPGNDGILRDQGCNQHQLAHVLGRAGF